MKLYLDGQWFKKEALIDLNIEADFIYLKLFKDIIVKKLKPVSIIEILFKKFQKLLRYYDIFFNVIDNL